MILILDCGSSKTPFIHKAVDEHMDARIVSILDCTESDLNDVLGVIISGAPILITEQNIDVYLAKTEWIKNTELPVLGICFGHQLLGIHFGSFGARMSEDRDWQTIEIFEEDDLFKRLPKELNMMEDHCETISIPVDFKLLGSSDACVNEAMRHKTRKLYGVQFHPEVSGNHGFQIFQNFVDICAGNVNQ